MQISTRLDCDLVAVESTDELTLLVEVNAPTPVTTVARPAATLQIVLDRSGSMGGDRLDGAKVAILALIDRLTPTDNLGIVTFDDEVQVVIPAAPLTDKMAAKHAVSAIESGGMTDLSAGYLRGLQEARSVAGPAGATVLLISDGHANQGIVAPDVLGKVAGEAASDQVTTSTLGFGLGYDEMLLAALAAGGRGNELFAEDADTAGALIGGEVDGLLTQVAQACSLRVTLSPVVQSVTLLNDLPCVGLNDSIMVELGSFYAAECRRLVLRLAVPGIANLGLAEVATLTFTHVSLPDLIQHTATLPVTVNVVPGDQAAGRVQDPTVVSEALFQQTQREKKEASRLLSEGRVEDASAILRASSAALHEASLSMPSALADELLSESMVMSSLADESTYDAARAAKTASYDNSRKSRQRGRQSTGGDIVLRWADGAHEGVLILAEWEYVRLARIAPGAVILRAAGFGPEGLAAEMAAQVSEPTHAAFFAGAAIHGGINVERA